MKASDYFPDEEERKEVRLVLDAVDGVVTKIVTEEGKVLFESNINY